MISIVMPVKDNKFYVEKCVHSVFLNTKEPYEFIIIDNASKQETKTYLENLLTNPHIKLITNQENKGCAYAWNQGIKAALGQYVCIINSDIIVPSYWAEVLKNFYMHHDFALISPCMREGELNYDLEKYVSYFKQKFKHHIFIDEYRGVCLFASKKIFEELGLFDEKFEIGKFEDEDLFMRIRGKKMHSAVISTMLVHHYGSKTINQVKKEVSGFEEKNRIYFHQKWKQKYLFRKINKIKISWRRKYIKWKYGVEY